MYFQCFSTAIVTIYQEPCIIFSRFLPNKYIFIDIFRKKKLKKLKIDNVRKRKEIAMYLQLGRYSLLNYNEITKSAT